jgi:hypothetical protein
MNLNSPPTQEQLRQLLAQGDDRSGHHVLWVDDAGEVHLSRVSSLSVADFEKSHPNARLRFAAFWKGNDYVGPKAAADEEWVAELLASLVREWENARRRDAVVAVDITEGA